MKMTFRWYGSDFDPISLKHIKQIPGMTGIVGTLFDIPAGEVWPLDKIKTVKETIEDHGLELKVIESVNIHEDIKLGAKTRDHYIENYKKTIENLGSQGVEVICYNFMPVFDWFKTDLSYELEDGSITMKFSADEIIGVKPETIVSKVADASSGYVLPGWEPDRLEHVQNLIAQYEHISEDTLRDNLKYFLEAIMPTCEKAGVKMAIHPDDPPYTIFGLPRIVKNRDDLDWIVSTVPSASNGLTLCTGSLGADPNNNIYKIIEEFSARGAIHFAHVRNIKFLEGLSFYEAAHLSEMGSLDMVKVMQCFIDNGFEGYVRPDHGRMIWGETGRPGYGLYDRAMGASYLIGIIETLKKEKESM